MILLSTGEALYTHISTKGFLYRGSTHLPVSLCASANQRQKKPKVNKAMLPPKKLTFWGNDPLRGKVYLTKTCYIRLSNERVSISLLFCFSSHHSAVNPERYSLYVGCGMTMNHSVFYLRGRGNVSLLKIERKLECKV